MPITRQPNPPNLPNLPNFPNPPTSTLVGKVQAGLLAAILGVGSWAVLTTDQNQMATKGAVDSIAEMGRDLGRIEKSVADIKTSGEQWATRQGQHNDSVDAAFRAVNEKLKDHGVAIADLSTDVAELKTPQIVKVPVPVAVPVPQRTIVVKHVYERTGNLGDAIGNLLNGGGHRRTGSGRRPGQAPIPEQGPGGHGHSH